MKTEALKCTIEVPLESLPDGRYSGSWTGCNVELTLNNTDYILATGDCIRGWKIPCTVVVNNGQVTVEA